MPHVAWGRMLGTIGLQVHGKICAVIVGGDALMLKVPKSRADELLAARTVQPVVMGGHPRKEWVEIPATADDSLWAELLDEAFTYVEALAAP